MISSAESFNTKGVLSQDSQSGTELIAWSIMRAFGFIKAAIAREKQVKHWNREKRLELIAFQNPTWKDLTEFLFPMLDILNKHFASSMLLALLKKLSLRVRRRNPGVGPLWAMTGGADEGSAVLPSFFRSR
jgi:hypothetical protein